MQIIEMSAPITRAVVFEDRAQVTRQGRIRLAAGSHRLQVTDTTPLAVDRSLQVRSASGDLRIGDCQVVRSRVWTEPEGLSGELEAALKRLEAREAELFHDQKRAQRRIELLNRWLADLKARLSAAVPRGIDPQPAAEGADQALREREAAAQALLEVGNAIADVQRERQEVQRRISLAGERRGIYVARLEAMVEASGEGEFEVDWTYVVPCALWRPQHRARLLGAGADASFRLETQAVIWQATGEPWDEIALVCSTARPGRASEAPALLEEVIASRRKTEQERREVVAEMRDEEIQTTGLGSNEGTAASRMPGVDDGGEALSWTVPGRCSVASNGRPLRVPLAHWEAPATVSRVCLPERLAQVVQKSAQVNPGPRPILAGPVVLYQGSGYVGRTSMGFVAPRERFALSFGSVDALRVNRERRVRSEETRLTGYQTRTVTVSLAFSNLSDQAASIEVMERVPVSELEAVRVVLADAAPARPDTEGRVSWSEVIPARGHLTRELVYRVEAPARVHLPL